MRIGFVVGSQFDGGAEEYVRRLSRVFQKNEDRCALIGDLRGWHGETYPMGFGAKWSLRTLPSALARLHAQQLALQRDVPLDEFDAFHSQFKREQVGFTRMLSRHAPVVWTEHGVIGGRLMRLIGPAYRKAAQYASSIICVSPAVAESVAKLTGQPHKIVTIENPVDPARVHKPTAEEIARYRRIFGIADSSFVVSWLGRLVAGKALDIVVRLAKALPNITFLVGGDGPMRASIDRQARLIHNLKLVGWTEPQQLLGASDVFLFTSRMREGYPTTTVLEAAGVGLSTVTNTSSKMHHYAVQTGGTSVPDSAAAGYWLSAFRHASELSSRKLANEYAADHSISAWAQDHSNVFHSLQSK